VRQARRPLHAGRAARLRAWRAGPAPDRLTADMCADRLGQGQLTLANDNRTVVLAGNELCTCASATGLRCAPGVLLVRGGALSLMALSARGCTRRRRCDVVAGLLVAS